MKIKRIILTSALASIFTLGTNLAFAEKGNYQGHEKGHKTCKHHGSKHGKAGYGKKGGMHGMKKMAEKLGLSEEQKTKIVAIKKEKREVMQSLRKQMHEIKNKLAELDPKSPNFKAEIFSIAEQKGVIAQRMVIEKGEKRFRIASILTDEQLAKKKEMSKQKKQHVCNHKGCKHKGSKHEGGHHGKHKCKHQKKPTKVKQ